MKLTTEPGALAAAVKFAARALTARAAYPILGGLKITAAPAAAWRWPRSTTRPRRGPAPAPRWASPAPCWPRAACWPSIAARLPRQPVELADDGPALTLTCGSTRYRLHLLPPMTTRRCPSWPPRPGRPTPPSSPPRSAR